MFQSIMMENIYHTNTNQIKLIASQTQVLWDSEKEIAHNQRWQYLKKTRQIDFTCDNKSISKLYPSPHGIRKVLHFNVADIDKEETTACQWIHYVLLIIFRNIHWITRFDYMPHIKMKDFNDKLMNIYP